MPGIAIRPTTGPFHDGGGDITHTSSPAQAGASPVEDDEPNPVLDEPLEVPKPVLEPVSSSLPELDEPSTEVLDELAPSPVEPASPVGGSLKHPATSRHAIHRQSMHSSIA